MLMYKCEILYTNKNLKGYFAMKFKKLAALAAALTICAAGLTACGDDASKGETTDSQTQSETTSNVQTEEELESENTSEGEESSAEPEESITDETKEEDSGSVLSAAAEAALEGSAWPALERIEDPDFIADFFLLDAGNDNYKDLLILKCPMSANLSELIIIEADDVSSAKADLEERRKKAQEKDAFYPDDVDKANASIVESEGTYAYFILGNDPEGVESALAAYLKSVQ